MRFRLRTLLTQFTIRDLFWLTALIALVVVWRSDLARQEAVRAMQDAAHRDMMARSRKHDYGFQYREVIQTAERHPELTTELKAIEAADMKNVYDSVSLVYRRNKLVDTARELRERDKKSDKVTGGQ